MRIPSIVLLGAGLLFVLSTCHKGGPSAPQLLGEHLQFCSDSCILQAPNVITPNGDGMGDLFLLYHYNLVSVQWTVRNSAQLVAFSTIDPNAAWDGHDANAAAPGPTAGRYTYTVNATATNGAHWVQQRVLWVVPDLTTPCFQPTVQPVFGDQFDPRLCGITYTTNERVCLFDRCHARNAPVAC